MRRQSARRLLANTDLDTGQVAFLLGFQELNSFTRAFHTWEGTTPSRWRGFTDRNPHRRVSPQGLAGREFSFEQRSAERRDRRFLRAGQLSSGEIVDARAGRGSQFRDLPITPAGLIAA